VVAGFSTVNQDSSIRFDPAAEKIVPDAEAARLAVPTYRAPWKLPRQYLNG